jgi:hypothetical protein
VVAGEGEDAVELVEPGHDPVDGVAVGLVDVDGVLAGQLEGGVPEVEAVGPVGLQDVVLHPVAVVREAAGEHHVGRRRARALDLEAAQRVVADEVRVGRVVAGDGDQVEDLAARDDLLVGHHPAVVVLDAGRRPRRLLPVVAGEHVDVRPLRGDGVHGGLEVLVGAVGQQALVERAQRGVGDGGDPLPAVRLADDQHGGGLLDGAMGRHRPRAGWELRGALLVGGRRLLGRAEHRHEDGHHERDPTDPPHAGPTA